MLWTGICNKISVLLENVYYLAGYVVVVMLYSRIPSSYADVVHIIKRRGCEHRFDHWWTVRMMLLDMLLLKLVVGFGFNLKFHCQVGAS